MIDEISRKYNTFSDAVIAEVRYRCEGQDRRMDIFLRAVNHEGEFYYENLHLELIGVCSFQFIEDRNLYSTVIFSALLQQKGEEILLDFFPEITEFQLLENPESNLQIVFKEIRFTSLGKYVSTNK